MVTTDYDVHPAALAFPMMQEGEYRELVADIREHGQRQPCAIYCGMLLDGRNRMRACQELGIEPLVQEVPEDTDPVDYVVSMNLMRRQLSTSQRAMVAATLATLKRGGDRGNQHTGGKGQNCLLPPTVQGAAELLNVSPMSVKHAKKVIEHGPEELADAVRRDAVPVSLAAKLIDAEPDQNKQAQLALQGQTAIKAHLGVEASLQEVIYEMVKERPRTTEELLEVGMHFQSAIRGLRLKRGINIQKNADGLYCLMPDGPTKRGPMPYDKVADAFSKLTAHQKRHAMRRINADPDVQAQRIKSLEREARRGDGTATDDMTKRLEECMNNLSSLAARVEGKRGAWLVKVPDDKRANWLRNARDMAANVNRLINKLNEGE